MEDQIKQCISILRNSNDNQNIQNATKWMTQLILEPTSINPLFNVYTSSEDQYDRQHAIIYLTKSIRICWKVIDPNARNCIFDMLTEILIREQIWFLRNLIIDAIYIIVTTSKYYEPLLNFISKAVENGTEESLLIAIQLAPLLQQFPEPVAEYLISLLDRGLSFSGDISPLQLEIKISSLHLLLFSSPELKKFPLFNDKFPAFWSSSVEILDHCKDDHSLLKRVTNYFLYALHQGRKDLDPLLLLQKTIPFFSRGEEDFNVLLLVFSIIQNICHFYPEAIMSCGVFPQIIELSISLSSYFYQPDDSLSLSFSNFFEPVYSDMCKTGQTLQATWDVITTISSSDHGRFYACCCLHATLRNFPSFFDDKLSSICQLLCISLSERKRLLCEAAAQTATVFIRIFEKELEDSNVIVKSLLEACKSDTSSSLLFYLTELLNTTRESEELFDDAFPFLMTVLTSGSLELRVASLSALSALASSSTVKINVHFTSLFSLLFDLLQSTNEIFEQLKPPAIETIAQAVSSVSDNILNENIVAFVSFCTANMNNNDLQIAVSCFNAIDTIVHSNSKFFLSAIEVSIPFLCELASNDVSMKYKSLIAESITRSILSSSHNDSNLSIDEDFDFDFDLDSLPQIQITAKSLCILSYLLRENVELCNSLGKHVIECCKVQSKSSSSACQIASAVAICNLSEGIAMTGNPMFENFPFEMSFILDSLISDLKYQLPEDADLLIAFFNACSKIVEWHEYEKLGAYLRPILHFALEILSNITSEPSYDSKAREVAENINSFLSMISASAEEQAPNLLDDFLTFYIQKLTNHPEIRFRSLAAHFFSDIMYSSSEVLNNNFKINMLSFSLTLADQFGDHYAFVCLRVVAAKIEEIEFAKKIANNVLNVCMSKITLPFIKSKKFLLMRDNAVSTLALYALNVFKENFNFDDCLPSILNALPLTIDFNDNESIIDFLIWSFNNKQNKKYSELFLKVLILMFSNPPSVLLKSLKNKLMLNTLLNMTGQLLSSHPDSNSFIFQVLEGDGERASILQRYLNDAAQEQNKEQ
ncbi:hypothetical protein M9Y10_020243 [Tritrichomonas musculus]|uniref:Importin N-terminal domain-containing protein n=1 Tax=Tritrichomonas musculus TaxID=1915356 RepID=A0ABR2HFM8_9EUKA